MAASNYELAMARTNERKSGLAEGLRGIFTVDTHCVLEVGCGHGHFLNAYAEAHPDVMCVGVDLITKRIEKSCQKAQRAGIQRLYFLKADIGEFLEVLPDNVVFDAVFMLFPDPWPKKRHFKNRMIQSDFLTQVAKRMGAGSCFYYRTDHEGYFEWTRELFAMHEDWKIDAEAVWLFEHATVFEKRMGQYQSLIVRRR